MLVSCWAGNPAFFGLLDDDPARRVLLPPAPEAVFWDFWDAGRDRFLKLLPPPLGRIRARLFWLWCCFCALERLKNTH